MNREKLQNTFGALAVALADQVLEASQSALGGTIPAAAVGHIGHAPGLTISDLSNAVSLSHAASVRLVDRLCDQGLVVRQKSKTDARSVELFLTKEGQRQHSNILTARFESLSAALDELNTREKNALNKITEKLIAKILLDESHAFRICRLCDASICKDCPVVLEMMSRESTRSNGV